ncbi:signal peptidase II [Vibrio crassostreae]|uniref:signal peptidase II n=1 Tax=Vibrio crassostreae TaxID=246167 RepID=UPI001B30F826|nr:signal peptidase II [Vibrio crassostreae]
MKMNKGVVLFLGSLLTLAVFAADQLAKQWAVLNLKGAGARNCIEDMFYFFYAENKGAHLGFGAELPDNVRFALMVVLTGLLLVGVCIWFLKKAEHTTMQLGMLFFALGGAAGNLYDRITNGYVVDYMVLDLGFVSTGVFNIADVVITIAGLFFMFTNIKTKEEKPAAEAA